MDTINLLLRDPKLWFAVYALVQAIAVYAWPDVPPAIKASVDALVVVVVGIVTAKGVVAKRNA